MSTYIKKIALIGGSGQVGSRILRNLLASPRKFQIIAVTRPDSSSSFPENPNLTVVRAAHTDHAGLLKAFDDVDATVITQGVRAPPEQQIAYINASVEAGVRWIIPNEWSGDGANEELSKAYGANGALRKQARQHIENKARELGKPAKWIVFVHNQWFDYSLGGGFYGIKIPSRKATFYEHGNFQTHTTTWNKVGLAVASTLSLPETASDGSTSLSDYANNFIYINSFRLSQRQMLDAVQRVTGTTDKDWEIDSIPLEESIRKGTEGHAKGDYTHFLHVIYGNAFHENTGANYKGTLSNDRLGLIQEDLDEEVRKVIENLKKDGKMSN